MKSMSEAVQKLAAFGERQGRVAVAASKYLCEELRATGVPYAIEKIRTHIPRGT